MVSSLPLLPNFFPSFVMRAITRFGGLGVLKGWLFYAVVIDYANSLNYP